MRLGGGRQDADPTLVVAARWVGFNVVPLRGTVVEGAGFRKRRRFAPCIRLPLFSPSGRVG